MGAAVSMPRNKQYREPFAAFPTHAAAIAWADRMARRNP